MHILTTKAAIQDDPNAKYLETYWNMVTINACYDTQKNDYTFQHKYRSKSIEIFFYKEMFWAVIVGYFSYIIY